jgi:hypothetical protein
MERRGEGRGVTGLLRAGLALMTVVELVLGFWTLRLPRVFYYDVPTIDLTPPYSEHLLRDFGGATLGLAVVLGAAAIWLERRLVIVALFAYLAFSVPHLVFHIGHLHGATGVEAVVLVGLLAAAVALPLLLLVLAARLPGRAAVTTST